MLDQSGTCFFLQRWSAEIDKCVSIFCDIVWWEHEEDSAGWADGLTIEILGRQWGTGLPKIFWFKASESPECQKSQQCFICIFGEIVTSQVKSNFISDIRINNNKKYNFQ